MDAVLDCESAATTLTSLATLLDLSVSVLQKRVSGLSPDSLQELSRVQDKDLPEVLWCHIALVANPLPRATCWFHATRVLPQTTFAEGILPLGDMLPRIRTELDELMHDCPEASQPDPIATSSVGNPLALASRMQLAQGQGPDAFLVRQAILEPDDSQHRFLEAPEAVEDVAVMLAGDRAAALMDCFRRATRPCIVKFQTTDPDPEALRAALNYAYNDQWGVELPCPPYTLGMDGQRVPPTAIAKVEFVGD